MSAAIGELSRAPGHGLAVAWRVVELARALLAIRRGALVAAAAATRACPLARDPGRADRERLERVAGRSLRPPGGLG